MPSPEPRLWHNGTVLGASMGEALYAEEGRVVAVGSLPEVLRSVPTGVERVDLRGGCVIPGLVDAHLHVAASVRLRTSVDVSAAPSIPELLDLLERFLTRHPGPVLGSGWDQERLAENRMPTRTDLDRLPTDRPVVLYRRCGHVATLNTAALAAAGLLDSTPDPPNGSLGRSGGSLDGRLFDGAMASLPALEDQWYPLDPAEVRRWLEQEASMGITAVGAMSAEPSELRSLRAAHDPGSPIVKVGAYLRARWLPEFPLLKRELDGPSLRVNGVKVMSDGSLGARTAWLSTPYEDAPSTGGTPLVGPAELEAILEDCAGAAATMAIHAIGDRALRGVLDAMDRVPAHGAVRVEHASVAPPALIQRAASLRVPFAVQPSFVTSDRWVPERLGAERARWAYPFRSMLDGGVRLAGSSDAPIESCDPWVGLAAATGTRMGADSGERLGPEEALSIYTRGGNQLLGETLGGTLSPGAPADLVVLRSPRWRDAISTGRSAVEATYVGARRTFVRDPAAASQGL